MAVREQEDGVKFSELPVGAHYRIPSAFTGLALPTVRVKVSETHYQLLRGGIKRLAAIAAEVIPVSNRERLTGERA